MLKLKIIDTYIIKELFISFSLSLSLLMSAFLTQQMLKLSAISADSGVSFLLLIKIAPLIIPIFLVLAIPFAMLLSAILTFARFSTDRELAAFKSAGISVYRMLLPVIVFSTGAFLMSLISSTVLQPVANHQIKKETYEAMKNQQNLGLQKGVFNNLFNLLIYVKDIKDTYNLEGVLISDSSSKGSRIITANRGKFLNDPSTESLYLKLEDGRIHYEFPDRLTYQLATFSTYYLKIETSKSIGSLRLFKSSWGMSLKELKKLLNQNKKEGKEREYRGIMLEFQRKFSLPAAVLVLGILGVPIGIRSRFSSRFGGFILSLIVVFFYYILDTGSEILTMEGIINPGLAAWMPVIIFILLTLITLIRDSRDNPLSLSK
ncbi:MAG: LptF/LptG family permease [Nitrospira sp.]|nr:LptF/LptG family permease [Nitrospira sp.]